MAINIRVKVKNVVRHVDFTNEEIKSAEGNNQKLMDMLIIKGILSYYFQISNLKMNESLKVVRRIMYSVMKVLQLT